MKPTKYCASEDGKRSVVLRPPPGCVCIVMVCTDLSEADEVGRKLSELNSGYLVTYRRLQDMLLNEPAGKVALVILATDDEPALTGRTLSWLRDRWPRCPVVVVGDVGSGPAEMTARQGGAYYLTRPVDPEQWSALFCHVVSGSTRPVVTEG